MGRQLIDLLVAELFDDIGHVLAVDDLGGAAIQVGTQLIPQVNFGNTGDGGNIGVRAHPLATMTGIT
ncbi:hypothetical protein D3C85_1906890 [compost metagenome]